MTGLRLTRRDFLALAAACGAGVLAGCSPGGSGSSAGGSAGTARPTRPPVPSTTATRARPTGDLLARRFSFGPTPSLRDLAARGPDRFFDDQLDPAVPDGATAAALSAALDARAATIGEPGLEAAERRRRAAGAVVLRTVALAAWSDRQVEQVMADFWADHLHVPIVEQPEVFFVPAYDTEVIRAHALGPFADLLVESARSAAMLVFLDNEASRADGANVPNENYARELLELHTVGIDGGYGEADVQEVAYVLSGWTRRPRSAEFAFREAWHALGPLAGGEGDVLGWRSTTGGVDDGEDLLHHLARHPATARHLGWKLARRFVADEVVPADPIVARLAAVYLAEDTAIGPVLRELGGSAELAAAGDRKTRRPLDLLTAMLRTGTRPATPAQLDPLGRPLANALRALGHVPYGWPAPDGYPEPAAAWIGPGALVARWNAAESFARGLGVLGPAPAAISAGGDGLAAFADALLGAAPSGALRTALASTDAGAAAARVEETERLARLRSVVFASPDFQAR